MTKRIEYVTINGETFREFHFKKEDYNGSEHYQHLLYCYDRPSKIKRNIYAYWENYFYGNRDIWEHIWSTGVKSFNCMMFTFGASVELGKWYNPDEPIQAKIYITKTRQEIYIYDL